MLNLAEKVRTAREMFSKGKNSKEVAKNLGYSDSSGLSAMMRRQGYRWDSRTQNYEFLGDSNGEALGNGAAEAVDLITRRANELEAMLDWFQSRRDDTGEPRIKRTTGPYVTKGFHLPVETNERLEEFCKRYTVNQKDVFAEGVELLMEQYE